MRWKDFLHFQRGSRLAVLLLLILIVLTMLLNAVLTYRRSHELIVIQNDSLVEAFEEFRSRLEERRPSLSPPPEARKHERNHSEKGDRRDDDGEERRGTDASDNPEEGDDRHYLSYPLVEKLNIGETITLNETDTTRWKMIPGIGSSYASRIVKYRELLGGYVRKEQLLEVYGMDDERYSRISPYIEPGGSYRKLQVNRAEFSELLRHPYLNYAQVKVIVSLRRRKGDILSINELAMFDEFTPDDIRRLEPYLAF